MELNKSTLLLHYKRRDIQEAMVLDAQDKEVGIRYGVGFGKRPDMLQYPSDILECAKNGATSFHTSEERWSNPLQIHSEIKPRDLEDLRIGWDLVIDIDCKFVAYTMIAADLVIKAIKHHGVSSVSCKFSGGSGFHIGIPFEAFPEKVYEKDTRLWFPDGPRAVAEYISSLINEPLGKEMLKDGGIEGVMKKSGLTFPEIVKHGKFNPLAVIGIDTLLISSRHLCRMAYSFNEKSGMVSVPVNPDKVLEFRKEIAVAKNVRVSKFKFLDRSTCVPGEARHLLVQSFDYHQKMQREKEDKENTQVVREYDELTEAIPEEFFPHCIKKILAGLVDGRKRAVFILINFLISVGWNYDAIEERINEWNKVNREPLREIIYKGQLRYHKSKQKKVLPPNCANLVYYKELGVKCEDNCCNRFKNPVGYAKAQVRFLQKEGKKKKPKKERKKEESKKKDKDAPTQDNSGQEPSPLNLKPA
ncbi:MAG: hypothetical protein O2779_02620 [Nanoarchaeota archaeon]|nr:hypothetical protein [Nanoarchaeota archaeon]